MNNILVYHDDGTPHHHPEVLPTGSNPAPSRSCAVCHRGPELYVVNAFKNDSKILVYRQASKDAYVFDRVFASSATIDSILHPFDLAFGDSALLRVEPGLERGHRRVDQRDASGGLPGVDAAVPAPREVPSRDDRRLERRRLPDVPTPAPPDVAAPLGLQVHATTAGRSRTSVRGVLVWGRILLVADEPADAVKAYEVGTGALIGQIADGSAMKAPVHLLLDASASRLYIGSTGTDSVVRYELARGLGSPTQPVAPKTFITGVKHPSGLAFGGDGLLYVAERKARKIKRFQSDGTPAGTFINKLPDEPEFIRYVPKS